MGYVCAAELFSYLSLNSIGPKLVIRFQTPDKIEFVIFDLFHRITLIFLLNWDFVCKNQGYGYGFMVICLLGPNWPKLVIRSQTPSKIGFVIFDCFNRKTLRFLSNCGLVCKNWGCSCGVDFVIFDSLYAKPSALMILVKMMCCLQKSKSWLCTLTLTLVFWAQLAQI